MIVWDTETTGLIEKGAVPLVKQPHIVEFAGVKLYDETLEPYGDLEFMCKPPIPLSEKITEITGLTDDDLKDCKPFAAYYKKLVDFFFGERVIVAHNLSYDVGMLSLELRRLDRLVKFPWPPEHKCTMELTKDIKGKWMKQGVLYKHYMGYDPEQEHRAMADVNQLVEVVRKMRDDGRL